MPEWRSDWRPEGIDGAAGVITNSPRPTRSEAEHP